MPPPPPPLHDKPIGTIAKARISPRIPNLRIGILPAAAFAALTVRLSPTRSGRAPPYTRSYWTNPTDGMPFAANPVSFTAQKLISLENL